MRGFLSMVAAALGVGAAVQRPVYRFNAPKIEPDREAPPSMRDVKRSRYTRHQGTAECARRVRRGF